MDEQAFPAYLQKHLDQRDWTRAELARKSGIHETRLSKWIHGEQTPGIENARQLAEAIGRPLLEVLVEAGLITATEARQRTAAPVDLSRLTDDQILAEVRRRMATTDVTRTLTDEEIAAQPQMRVGRPKRRKASDSPGPTT